MLFFVTSINIVFIISSRYIESKRKRKIMASSKIKEIKDLGQSIWLDYFDRKIMDSGQLKRLIESTGITGITSNPFATALAV